ncbi:DUF1501 domain-containing protein [Agarivorans sp. B2Z047]|uniref:DUF1501 domain-containing protein n=1 Tax=Agarivorans sp. B2Z047 TaxID=2652721 RepID=UPI00128D958C|nr:DUF1501 domain-containing protein [Agarivorans sp. B2Z047]MPW29192.1 DUF1501 domain-containing protein [Agarivorans sp. B2Z047]UQN41745.1 DUF1501 domain-containing protein [Agarivorans sp. B2Z047]
MTYKNRREFLSLCLKGGVSMAALSSMQLKAMTSLATPAASADGFKALVCIFLKGGNDSFNMLIPQQGDPLAAYLNSRQNLAVSDSIAIDPVTAVDGGIGLNPALSPIAPLFNNQKLAVVSGVGSLVAPITLEQYKAKSAAIPNNLFSHNDQQATWMQGREKESINYGWGGRILELLNQHDSFGSNISLSGNNLWQTGPNAIPFAMNKSGITRVNAYNSTSQRTQDFRQQLEQMFSRASHPLAKNYSDKLDTSISNTEQLNEVLGSAEEFTGVFGDNDLSMQLLAVAKTLSVQSQFGVGRQVYFVGMGGFDTHDDQNVNHPALLLQLSQAMAEFDSAMTSLGLSNQVTTFTMSDFGRTLSSNGDGTDHGWAGNQLVMGGAVNGGEIYGSVIEQALDSAYDVGGGRMIPQVANEQYFASLARWFGLSDSEVLELFPSLSNFNQSHLSMFS